MGARVANVYRFVRNDSIMSGLAVTAILALSAKYLAPAAVWPWILNTGKSFLEWLKSEHTIYGWIILVLLLFGLIAILQSWMYYKKWREQKLKPKPPEFLKYCSDEIFGFKWSWSWNKYYSHDDHKLKHQPVIDDPQICPKCAGDLTPNSYCLLYTSPSPRDRTRSRMPSSA